MPSLTDSKGKKFMNRIYQGKVTAVEIPDGKDEQGKPLNLDVLWRHHELFQDAVNYYIVCLLALAGDSCAKQRELRDRMTTKPEGGNEEPLYVWERFRRRGAWRRGLGDSVTPYLCPGKTDASAEECFAAVLAGNECVATEDGRSLFDRGLRQLLSKCTGASGCRNAAPEFLPRFCDPNTKCSFVEDAGTMQRDIDKAVLPFVLHDPTVSVDSAQLDTLGVHSIAWPDGRKPEFRDEEAKEKLRLMLHRWRECQPELAPDWARLEQKIEALPDNLVLPSYAATAAKSNPVLARNAMLRIYAMYFFSKVERSEFTLNLLRATTAAPKPEAKRPEPQPMNSGGDPIRLARGQRGYVFRAFTSLAFWGGNESGEAKWLRFDVAAFEEALKAIHQVDDKAKEREDERNQKLAQHKYQRGETKKWKGGGTGEEEQRPPVLVGDPRIARLEQLVDVELRAEYEMSEGVEVKYGLHPRTIRGFRDVRKRWNEALQPGQSYSAAAREQMWKLLTDYKKENSETIGSPVLFDALVEESNWIIWREPDAAKLQEWSKAAKLPEGAAFCDDPLQALTDERELLADIERLRDPIRLTPADPVHSRRQFYFSDMSDLTKKNRLRHDKNYLDAEIADKENGKWIVRSVRIRFGAPRMLRDQLKSDEEGKDSAWQQAMMAALGLKAGLVKNEKGKLRPASFAECAAVALMPEVTASGERRILLNFPLTLEDDAVARQLGKAARWDANQFGPNFKNSSWLRWPSTPDANARSRPWWESSEPFRCLPVDLGQRDAGAFALLEITPGNAPKPQSRKLGDAGGKTWWATVRATGMLRLPGEDAKVFRDGNPRPQEELSGELGRNLVAGEWQEARDICAALGFQPDKLLSSDERRYSFPELNDRLLYALRRAQARLARLQGWSCVAYDEPDEKKRTAFEKRRKRIKEQIAEAIVIRAAEEMKEEKDRGQELLERSKWLGEVKNLVEKEAWDAVATRIKVEIESEREIIKRELVRIADRIQPLRGRRWEWVTRSNDTQNHILQQTERGTDERPKLLAGQRGLSMKRIEQLESLRQRCQSLNRALRQEPGRPANLGRSKRGIELPDPCPELLDRLDALKEQRVNQTAHLILAQALGVRLRPHATSAAEREKHDIHGEYDRIPGREPVDFVVIENLKYYEMSQGRARSENARLMKWCRRHLRDKLIQLCEPYGLRVLEEWPADTSKFCSLTGVAGFRAVELTPENAMEFRWKKHLDRLADLERLKKLNKDERGESNRVKALFDALEKLNAVLLKNRPARPKWRTLLAPLRGGPIFVPMRGKPFQADINAAINLGLRAIAAPENQEIHLRIRSERKGEKFFVRAQNIREKARWNADKHEITPPNGKSLAGLLTESNPYFYADTGSIAEFDHAEISGQRGFASSRGIWGTIKQKDWLQVGKLNNDRLEKAGLGRLLEEEDDVPK
jgi:hypothetical protein